MCGFLFISSNSPISTERFGSALNDMSFRGPDSSNTLFLKDNKIGFGHNRLQIIGNEDEGLQPMTSFCGRFIIIFNGEIYNFKELNESHCPDYLFSSDTRLLIELYAKLGSECLNLFEGMFAFVIYDLVSDEWFACRDRFGIKPLFYYQDNSTTIISSEIVCFRHFIDLELDLDSVTEWKKFRRCCPNHTFYSKVYEVLPASYKTDSEHSAWYIIEPSDEPFCFEDTFNEVVADHLCSDVDVTCLLSGGVDSSLLASLTNLKTHYTVGLKHNNEFDDVKEFCDHMEKFSYYIEVESEELPLLWAQMTQRRLEPLCVPNEALIYSVCMNMPSSTKVVLSGEGADEVMFGYDRIFRYAHSQSQLNTSEFLEHYSYSNAKPTNRILDYISNLSRGKAPIEFCEDFFLHFHLPCLLRRVDFSMMLASKEGRVPFVDRRIIEPLYRKSYEFRNKHGVSKSILKEILNKKGLNFVSERKKIGFSTIKSSDDKKSYYENFQNIMLKELKWL